MVNVGIVYNRRMDAGHEILGGHGFGRFVGGDGDL